MRRLFYSCMEFHLLNGLSGFYKQPDAYTALRSILHTERDITYPTLPHPWTPALPDEPYQLTMVVDRPVGQ